MTRSALVVSLVLFACDGGVEDEVGPPCTAPEDATIRLVASPLPGFSRITGVSRDSAIPRVQTEKDRVGDCVLLAKDPPNCLQPCPNTCVSGICWRSPAPKAAGVVSVFYGSTRLFLRQETSGFYESLNFDPLFAGAPLRVSSEEFKSIAAFEVTTPMVEMMAGDFSGLVATPDDDLKITWRLTNSDNPDDEVIVRIVGDSEQALATIECVVPPPTASVTIDKRLLAGLDDLDEGSIDGFIRYAEIERRNVQLKETRSDCVSLTTSSLVPIAIDSAAAPRNRP